MWVSAKAPKGSYPPRGDSLSLDRGGEVGRPEPTAAVLHCNQPSRLKSLVLPLSLPNPVEPFPSNLIVIHVSPDDSNPGDTVN